MGKLKDPNQAFLFRLSFVADVWIIFVRAKADYSPFAAEPELFGIFRDDDDNNEEEEGEATHYLFL